jgi:hypothetical protein
LSVFLFGLFVLLGSIASLSLNRNGYFIGRKGAWVDKVNKMAPWLLVDRQTNEQWALMIGKGGVVLGTILTIVGVVSMMA